MLHQELIRATTLLVAIFFLFYYFTQADREAHSSVVLGRLWRGPVAGEWEWSPLRALCGGSVGDYGPILRWIEAGGLDVAKPDFFQLDSPPYGYSTIGDDEDAEGRSGWR